MGTGSAQAGAARASNEATAVRARRNRVLTGVLLVGLGEVGGSIADCARPYATYTSPSMTAYRGASRSVVLSSEGIRRHRTAWELTTPVWPQASGPATLPLPRMACPRAFPRAQAAGPSESQPACAPLPGGEDRRLLESGAGRATRNALLVTAPASDLGRASEVPSPA